MKIEKTEVEVKYTMREAQSLLLILRALEDRRGGVVNMTQIPASVFDDMRYMRLSLEELLLMDNILHQ